MSLADDILAADDMPREPVTCWGKSLFVRTLNSGERDQFDADTLVTKGKKREANLLNLRARLVVATLVDADGVSVFNSSHVTALSTKSAKEVDKLFGVAQRLCGMTDDDVENAIKN